MEGEVRTGKSGRPLMVAALVCLLAVGIVAVLDVATEPQWANRAREWITAVAAVVLAFLTWAYVKATDAMSNATRQLAQETERQRLETYRPRVVLRFFMPESILVELLVENIGLLSARNVTFEFSHPLLGLEDRSVSDLPMFTEGVAEFPPGAQYRFVLGAGVDFFGEQGRQRRYDIDVGYEAPDGRKFHEKMILDISHAFGSRATPEPHDKVMAESLRKIALRLESAKDFYSPGILVVTPADVRAIQEEWRADRDRLRGEDPDVNAQL